MGVENGRGERGQGLKGVIGNHPVENNSIPAFKIVIPNSSGGFTAKCRRG